MAETKAEIRKAVRTRREAMSPGEVAGLSALVLDWFWTIPDVGLRKVYALYAPTRNEVDVLPLAEELLAAQKIVLLPRTVRDNRRLDFCRIQSPRDLVPGNFGILEPGPGCALWDAAQIDTVVIPGVAFDRAGHRLGFGGGYYDRFLPRLSPGTLKVALAFDFQLLESLPVEAYDQCVSIVVTDTGLMVPIPSTTQS